MRADHQRATELLIDSDHHDAELLEVAGSAALAHLSLAWEHRYRTHTHNV